MNKKNISVALAAIGCCVALSGNPSHAAEMAQSGACEPGSATPYIQPTCSKCANVKVERQTSASGNPYGVLELVYFDEVYVTFAGTIEMTVHLTDGNKHPVTIDDVLLTNGEEAGWVIDGTSQWSWCDVEMVELVFVLG